MTGRLTCTIRPYEGVSVAGYGDVSFGMTMDEVRSVLGPGFAHRRFNLDRTWPNELDYIEEPPLWMRLAFDDRRRRCQSIEFNWPRGVAPILAGVPLAGPRLRETTTALAGMGLQPWTDDGPLHDIADVGSLDSIADSIKFHEIGLSLWSSTATETEEDGALGEFALDTVFLWQPGYWEKAKHTLGLRLALPAAVNRLVSAGSRHIRRSAMGLP